MAFEEALRKISVPASADLSGNQYNFVVINGDGELALATAGGSADGVLQNDPEADEAGSMATEGVSKVVAGEAITAGANVAVGATGRAAAAGVGEVVVGRALEGASGDGVVIAVLLGRQYATA